MQLESEVDPKPAPTTGASRNSQADLRHLDLSAFSALRVLVAGDFMLDEYLWGRVERISPEAPVAVVEVERETRTLGGAGNVVNNLVALGACAPGTAPGRRSGSRSAAARTHPERSTA